MTQKNKNQNPVLFFENKKDIPSEFLNFFRLIREHTYLELHQKRCLAFQEVIFNKVLNKKSTKKSLNSLLNKYKDLNPLVLFSGDIYSPSKLGQIMKGRQMIPFLERFKIDVSCVGNHDLDYGVDRFIDLKGRTPFPWLCTNVTDTQTNKPLADALDHVILEHEGIKIGIIGLAEEEWLDSIVSLEEDDFIFEDFIKSGRKWCKKLREEGCEIVIALTHMRMPNDKKLAQKVPDLDIILGGHDHCSAALNINDILLCKSGTDFREFSIIKVRTGCSKDDLKHPAEGAIANPKKELIMTCEKVEITKDFEPEEDMKKVINEYWEELAKKLDQPAGYTAVELDARFDQIRCKETNISNFVADVIKFAYKTDVVLLNSGSLRADEVIPAGIFRWKEVDTLFPIQDSCVVIRVTGENLLKALENGVSEVPKLEGRFPCVSGVRFKYDPKLPGGERITEIEINGEPPNKKKLYTVATKDFLYKGKDGYDDL